MSKDDRSSLNPFTGKEHYDTVNDDKFLEKMSKMYYNDINKYELLDSTPEGQLVLNVALKLIKTVEEFLIKIGRSDYVEDYYEWEFHLLKTDEINAYCFAGGKIGVYSGIFQIANTEEKLAFVIAHELSHALLDHSRSKYSVQQTRDAITGISWIGSIALDVMGYENAGSVVRGVTSIADLGVHYFLTKPWGRSHEYEADKLGMIITHLAGYDIHHIPNFWQEFSGGSSSIEFFATHPSDDKRIAVMKETLDEILNEPDFYSKPVLAETPTPKDEYMLENNENIPQIPSTTNKPITSASAFTNSSVNTNSNTCNSCGNIIKPTDKFCMKCGNKVEFNMKNTSTCPNCGYQTMNGDRFCKKCGTNLTSQELRCSVCNEKIKEEQVFCMNCGNKIK